MNLLWHWWAPRALACVWLTAPLAAAPAPVFKPDLSPGSQRREPVVDVHEFCPGVFIELRYATKRNLLGRPIYPANARCLLCRSVAVRLNQARDELLRQGYALKVWDAFRPIWAQEILWKAVPKAEYVASPTRGGSWHSWGASVDVTLVDLGGHALRMPSDFDDFTAAARSTYRGGNPAVAVNLKRLQHAMKTAGFKGVNNEWWHFTAEVTNYRLPVQVPLVKGGAR